MNRRDQELLDKQVHITPGHDGIMMLAIFAVFLTGMAFGGFISAYTDEPGPKQIALSQIASNDVTPAIALPQGPITRP
jgi:hypothetical protein